MSVLGVGGKCGCSPNLLAWILFDNNYSQDPKSIFFFDFIQFWRFAGRKTAYGSKFHPKILLTNFFFKHKHIIYQSFQNFRVIQNHITTIYQK